MITSTEFIADIALNVAAGALIPRRRRFRFSCAAARNEALGHRENHRKRIENHRVIAYKRVIRLESVEHGWPSWTTLCE
ncbi:hypothetical protein [Paraburkholderia nodosa]|uniref:hypothetical protein n=1 Tax=Paraburkholderia nodosa TaxID=392320 RepID=UPI00114D0C31|nr:hypothetical protein [Paraburkholderia nodosa]